MSLLQVQNAFYFLSVSFTSACADYYCYCYCYLILFKNVALQGTYAPVFPEAVQLKIKLYSTAKKYKYKHAYHYYNIYKNFICI